MLNNLRVLHPAESINMDSSKVSLFFKELWRFLIKSTKMTRVTINFPKDFTVSFEKKVL